MNEYKVQLESREDLSYLKDEMMKYFEENGDENIFGNLKQQFFDRVFSIVAENCQVNGVDFAELISQNSSIEPVNNVLVTKLQEMQAETENLLTRTIEYRRQVPQMVKTAFIEQTGRFMEAVEGDFNDKFELKSEDLEICSSIDRSIKPNFYSNKLSSGLSHLVQLQSSIPDVVAKLERAQAVINEEGGKRLDESNQILHRHRRLSRQFDLASKIGGNF